MKSLSRWALAVVASLAAAGPIAGQAELGPFPGAVTGPGFVVRYGEGDSLRAQAVAEAIAAQPPLPAIADTLPKGITVVLDQSFRRNNV